jgi:hypothetical protein
MLMLMLGLEGLVVGIARFADILFVRVTLATAIRTPCIGICR